MRLPIVLMMVALAAAGATVLPIRGETDDSAGEEFSSLQTEHWLITYSTTDEVARRVGEILERTRAIFIETFERIGVALDERTELLKCDLYVDPDSYTRHMRSLGRPAEPTSFGWYSPVTNRLTLIKPTITEAAGIKITLVWSAAHEGAHQLSYHLGLLERGSSLGYPPWFIEGVAGAFETNDPDADFGPFSGYVTEKVRVIREHAERGEHAPLIELSDMRLPGSSSPQDRFENVPMERIQIYAQGASLAIFLITHRPEEFRNYLNALSSRSRSRSAPKNWRAAFRDAFGDIDALETEWKRWLIGLEPAS